MAQDWQEREGFLQAIFAEPQNDLPRLVFADWLEERGELAWAELIRVQCQGQANLLETLRIIMKVWGEPAEHRTCERGFLRDDFIRVDSDWLHDDTTFREIAVSNFPHWYGADRLTITEGKISSSTQLQNLLASPVTQNVTIWDLNGEIVPINPAEIEGLPRDPIDLLAEFVYEPRITARMVEQLCQSREARRIVELDLRYNELDNDAARSLARSTSLIRLQRLYLLEGNRIRGQTWQSVLARYGDDVVS